MSSKFNNGYLELIIGPMFSGKTSELLEIYKKCNFCNIPVSIINHNLDIRYHDTMVSSHNKIMAPCIQTDKLSEIWFGCNTIFNSEKYLSHKLLRESDVILINEGQFFSDLYETVIDMLKNNKKIYICGLDGDFERKKFGFILDLIPLCDAIKKLKSLCSLCRDGTDGIFSMRLTDEKEQTVIGVDNYIPVCRNCYEQKCNKNT
jgi:thymidine kinase